MKLLVFLLLPLLVNCCGEPSGPSRTTIQPKTVNPEIAEADCAPCNHFYPDDFYCDPTSRSCSTTQFFGCHIQDGVTSIYFGCPKRMNEFHFLMENGNLLTRRILDVTPVMICQPNGTWLLTTNEKWGLERFTMETNVLNVFCVAKEPEILG